MAEARACQRAKGVREGAPLAAAAPQPPRLRLPLQTPRSQEAPASLNTPRSGAGASLSPKDETNRLKTGGPVASPRPRPRPRLGSGIGSGSAKDAAEALRLARGKIARRFYQDAPETRIVLIQRAWREHRQRGVCRMRRATQVLKRNCAAVLLQRAYRRSRSQHVVALGQIEHLCRLWRAVVAVQRFVRGYLVRRSAHLTALRSAARRVQRWWRQVLSLRVVAMSSALVSRLRSRRPNPKPKNAPEIATRFQPRGRPHMREAAAHGGARRRSDQLVKPAEVQPPSLGRWKSPASHKMPCGRSITPNSPSARPTTGTFGSEERLMSPCKVSVPRHCGPPPQVRPNCEARAKHVDAGAPFAPVTRASTPRASSGCRERTSSRRLSSLSTMASLDSQTRGRSTSCDRVGRKDNLPSSSSPSRDRSQSRPRSLSRSWAHVCTSDSDGDFGYLVDVALSEGLLRLPRDPPAGNLAATGESSSISADILLWKATSLLQDPRVTNRHMYCVERPQQAVIYRAVRVASNSPTEQLLWHGTDWQSVWNILRGGFNRSYSGRHGSRLGVGTYFSADAEYALRFSDRSGPRALLLARVTVGRFTRGMPGLVEAPPLPEESAADGDACRSPAAGIGRYDSTVDCVENPRVFCVFRDFQALPVGLVICA